MRQTRFLPDDAATAELGSEIGATLRSGDLVTLSGDLGAGKTALARAILRALAGDPGLDVPSPTFALVQPYDFGRVRVLHADLYRLAAERDADELGLFDDPDAIVMVEWPDRAPALAAAADIRVVLSIPPDGIGRNATIETATPRPA